MIYPNEIKPALTYLGDSMKKVAVRRRALEPSSDFLDIATVRKAEPGMVSKMLGWLKTARANWKSTSNADALRLGHSQRQEHVLIDEKDVALPALPAVSTRDVRTLVPRTALKRSHTALGAHT